MEEPWLRVGENPSGVQTGIQVRPGPVWELSPLVTASARALVFYKLLPLPLPLPVPPAGRRWAGERKGKEPMCSSY